MTSNPLRILRTFDRHLRSPVDLYVYGRSALAMGFAAAPTRFHATMDVDAILPAKDIRFLVAQADCQPDKLNAALDRAVVPPVTEIKEAFSHNRAWLRDTGLLPMS